MKPDTKHILQTGDTLRFGIPIINGNSKSIFRHIHDEVFNLLLATHKPPEFKVVFVGSATSQLLSTAKESAFEKWQFVVPESESSCEGDDDLSSVIQIDEPFTSPSKQAG